MRQILAAFAALALSLFAVAAVSAEPAVGFQHLTIPDPKGPPIEIGIWYPTDAKARDQAVELFNEPLAPDAPVKGRALPLVVISHGHGGSFAGHIDTAVALARAGFVAAALTHTGDNYRDLSRGLLMWERPRQLKVLTDYMLGDWARHAQLDPARVGAFGFSSGGFTVLAAAGGEPNLSKVAAHCVAHPQFYDCALNRGASVPLGFGRGVTWTHDPRIRAVVSAAPALGFTFGRAGLAGVRQPVQLWRAADDHVLPHPFYAEAVRLGLPAPPETHVVSGADHYDFLAPCTPPLATANPEICASARGFDRAAFHRDFNQQVVTFFQRTLPP